MQDNKLCNREDTSFSSDHSVNSSHSVSLGKVHINQMHCLTSHLISATP